MARRVVAKLEQAAAHPERFFQRLAGSGEYKVRVGDYRVIAALTHERQTIIVERVDHRSRVYERRR